MPLGSTASFPRATFGAQVVDQAVVNGLILLYRLPDFVWFEIEKRMSYLSN